MLSCKRMGRDEIRVVIPLQGRSWRIMTNPGKGQMGTQPPSLGSQQAAGRRKLGHLHSHPCTKL